jgi:hypothetical protein
MLTVNRPHAAADEPNRERITFAWVLRVFTLHHLWNTGRNPFKVDSHCGIMILLLQNAEAGDATTDAAHRRLHKNASSAVQHARGVTQQSRAHASAHNSEQHDQQMLTCHVKQDSKIP